MNKIILLKLLILLILTISTVSSIISLINNNSPQGPSGSPSPTPPSPSPSYSPSPPPPPSPPSPPIFTKKCDKLPIFPPYIDHLLHPTVTPLDKLRVLVLHNNSSEDLYASLDASTFINKIDKGPLINPTKYSGFKIKSKEFYPLQLPKYVDSGRIWVRTGCSMSSGYEGSTASHKYDSSTPILWCDTGNCPLPPDAYASSSEGKLCYDGKGSIIGGLGPTTPIEFTFASTGVDYYDISQVDGNNISVSMIPISQNFADKPSGTPDEFWCKGTSCYPNSSINKCPNELRVYSESGKFITCQSIYQAMSGIPDNYNRLDPPGLYPNGKLSQNIDILKVHNEEGYNKLMKLHNSRYNWKDGYDVPPSQTDPSKSGRKWFKKGRWVLDTSDTSDTSSACSVQDEIAGKCLRVKTVACCEGFCDVKTSDKSKKMGCSPNDNHFTDIKYQKHLCWSEMWPKPDQSFCEKNNLEGEDCNYHTIFKKQCPKAYSWQFDDMSSTYTCKSSDNEPINYYIGFCDKI